MLSSRSICPKCKRGPFLSGNAFSVHLSYCTAQQSLWDLYPQGANNYERLQNEASIPSTLRQQLNEASRGLKRPPWMAIPGMNTFCLLYRPFPI